jgi:hypothetical protein
MWDVSSEEEPRETLQHNAEELRRLAENAFTTHNQEFIKELKARRDAESDDEGERKSNPTQWERKSGKTWDAWKESRSILALEYIRAKALSECGGHKLSDCTCEAHGCGNTSVMKCADCTHNSCRPLGALLCSECDVKQHPYAHTHRRTHLKTGVPVLASFYVTTEGELAVCGTLVGHNVVFSACTQLLSERSFVIFVHSLVVFIARRDDVGVIRHQEHTKG